MKIQEIDRGYGVEVKATGKDWQIIDLSNKLSSSGYNVGNMVSDFRPSYLITDAPLKAVVTLNKGEAK